MSTNAQFQAKKTNILQSLSRPSDAYNDLSPKGSVDEGIRSLIDAINTHDDFVTTSSCSGRVAVFLEAISSSSLSKPSLQTAITLSQAQNLDQDDRELVGPPVDNAEGTTSSWQRTSGKGAGGKWLYVSHESIPLPKHRTASLPQFLGLGAEHSSMDTSSIPDHTACAHFKFEPMILHILAASVKSAQSLLTAALQAGFRESGVTGLNSACPMVAVRCQGLAFDSIVGVAVTKNESDAAAADVSVHRIVSEPYLELLAHLANERFEQNRARIDRFHQCFEELRTKDARPSGNANWESTEARRARKRAEGLQRQQQLRCGQDT